MHRTITGTPHDYWGPAREITVRTDDVDTDGLVAVVAHNPHNEMRLTAILSTAQTRVLIEALQEAVTEAEAAEMMGREGDDA